MGWMHDTLRYMRNDPIHRRYHHTDLTFRGLYAFTENFLLPLSHDEVVHGKGSLLGAMPGDTWQQFANLRLLLSFMYADPGKKLLFMGGEFGQWQEWKHDASLDWDLAPYERHAGIQCLVADLNRLYREEPALHRFDCNPAGFEWLETNDWEQSTLAFLRKGAEGDAGIVVACNFTPVPRQNYRVGVPSAGPWIEILNTDAREYGGSGQGNLGGLHAVPVPSHGHRWSIVLTLPPLATVLLRSDGTA
jgi:1,4-alpha-glucan branching enzyme